MRRAFWSSACLSLAVYVGCSGGGGSDSNDGFGPPDGGGTGGTAGAGGSAMAGQPGSGGDGGGMTGGTAGGVASGGAGAGGTSGTGGAGAAGGTAGATGSGGAGGSGGTIVGAGGVAFDGSVPDVKFNYDPPDVQVEACADETAEAELVPLDMYIILDRSGSMGSDCNIGSGGTSKWCAAINALSTFFNAPTSADMRVALNFFSDLEVCNGSSLAFPAVNLDLLSAPGHIMNLQTALNNAAPGGATHTEAALRGLAAFTAANEVVGRTMIGVLITDGDPNGCDEDTTRLANIASAHFMATGIQIFPIGMQGATFSRLEAWGVAGGVPTHTNFCGGGINPCHHYDVGSGNGQVLVDALRAIQTSALGCTYNVPTTSQGVIDPTTLEVTYTPGGGAPISLQRVTTQAQCTGAGGFYFDNNLSPTTITLCQATCDQVSTDANAQVGITIKCEGS